MRNNLAAEVELIPGSGGVFAVAADGREVFSKKKGGRFPSADELLSLIKGR